MAYDPSQLEPIRALHAAGRSAEALQACRELLNSPHDRRAGIAGTLALKLGQHFAKRALNKSIAKTAVLKA